MLEAIKRFLGRGDTVTLPMRIYSMNSIPRDLARIIESALSEGDHAFERMGKTSDDKHIICVQRTDGAYVATVEFSDFDIGLGKSLIVCNVSAMTPEKVAHFVEVLREL